MHRLFRLRPLTLTMLLFTLLVAGAFVLLVPAGYTEDRPAVTGDPHGGTSPSRVPDATPVATPTDHTAVVPAAEVDQAVWQNGELVAPLPKDPERLRAALAQAQANGASRMMPSAGVQQQPGSPGSSDGSRSGSRSTLDPILNVVPFVPADARSGGKTWNLKMPDRFVADPALVRGIDPATGKKLPQAQQDAALATALAPALSQTFDGISQTTLTPPDCDVSAGPTNVVAAVNARFAIYDKCGNNLYENNIATFIGDGTNFFFDPKVLYDVWSNRWLITCCVRNNTTHGSWILLLYSDDSDPIGSWGFHYVDFTLNGGTANGWWADYQDVGTDPNAIYLTANMFNWASPAAFQYSKLRCLDKADVLNGGGICWWDFWSLTNPGDGSLAFTMRACDMNSWPGDFWLMNDVSYGAAILTLWKVTGATVCTGPALVSFNVAVGAYDDPPAMLQPNGTFLDCGDARLLNASYAFGNIFAAHSRRINWGEASDRSAIAAFIVQPYALTVSFQTAFGAAGLYYSYPAIDFDDGNNAIVAFARGGPGENPGSRYVDIPSGGGWGASGLLHAGATSYTGSVDAGTAIDPFRWGDYYGCDRDPFDNKTLWMYGQYTVDAFNWDTQVGATAPNGAGLLSITPSPGLVSAGYQGGPFSPGGVTYTLSNIGGSAFTWSLSGVDAWNTATSSGGQIIQGGSVFVGVNLNGTVNGFAPGVYTDNYLFTNCYGGGSTGRSTVLHVGTNGACNGARLALTPNVAPPNYANDGSTNERGIYITAIKNFNVCALGYKLQVTGLPQTLIARIYAASGTTRGALLASGSIALAQLGDVVQFVPISYTLQACKDYELVCVIPALDGWEWWSEPLIAEPFDIGGAIRVRDGSLGGAAGNTALGHMELIGSAAPSPAMLSDFAGTGVPNTVFLEGNEDRGIYVHLLDTGQLCSFGWEADLPVGSKLTARVYDASGTIRGALVATGTYTVPLAGLRFHDVPINAQLQEGRDYDLSIEFGATNSWNWWNENIIVEPFTKDIYSVITSESSGDGTNFALPHYRAYWEEKTGGSAFDLPKITDVFPAPNSTAFANATYGAYITSVIRQEAYAVGWMANVPTGQPITARVYRAVGTARGALISEGTVYSSGPGMKWHDVPVAAELLAAGEYDIAIEWAGVTEWRYWSDLAGMPYTINGVITVRNSEAGGDASNFALPYMRVFACNGTLTPVDNDHPQRTPMFIATPAPNPVNGTSRLDFALEEAGPVSINVYDVAGRRVATILDGAQRSKGWHSVDLDSQQLASGVYFLKMQTRAATLSRKFVVTH